MMKKKKDLMQLIMIKIVVIRAKEVIWKKIELPAMIMVTLKIWTSLLLHEL